MAVMEGIFAQVLVGLFLLMCGGIVGWIAMRVTKATDMVSTMDTRLSVAINDIEHLKEKTATHTGHIDKLFEMQKSIVEIQTQVKHLSETMPQVLGVMTQLAALAQKRAA